MMTASDWINSLLKGKSPDDFKALFGCLEVFLEQPSSFKRARGVWLAFRKQGIQPPVDVEKVFVKQLEADHKAWSIPDKSEEEVNWFWECNKMIKQGRKKSDVWEEMALKENEKDGQEDLCSGDAMRMIYYRIKQKIKTNKLYKLRSNGKAAIAIMEETERWLKNTNNN